MNGRVCAYSLAAMRWAPKPLLFVAVFLSLSPVKGTSVALCFFGLTRSLELTIGNIRNSIIDPLLMADIHVSIYLHTFDLKATSNQRSAENMTAMNWKAYKLLQPDMVQIDNAHSIEKELIEPSLQVWLKHGDAWEESGDHTTLKNFLKQLYSLSQVTQLWMAGSKAPDVVFYLRSDMWFFNTFDVAEVEQAIKHNNTLYTPYFHRWQGLNDRLAFGVPAVMEVYGNRLANALIFSDTEAIHAERFLLHTAKQAGLDYSGETSLVFERVRATGELWGIPTNSSVRGDDFSYFHKQPGLKIQKGPLGTIEIVPL